MAMTQKKETDPQRLQMAAVKANPATAEGRISQQDEALCSLSALAQGTRLEVFRLLCCAGEEGIAAGEIARRVGIPHNTLSTHLAILQNAGLIQSERKGRQVTYSLVPHSLEPVLAFLGNTCRRAMP